MAAVKNTAVRLKDIPAIPEGVSPDLRKVLVAMREHVQAVSGMRGTSPVQRGSGGGGSVVVVNPGGGTGGGGTSPTPDLTPPPDVANLRALGGVNVVFIEFDVPTYTQGGGNAFTLIYGLKKAPGGGAVTFPGTGAIVATIEGTQSFYALASEFGTEWHLWAVHVTKAGRISVNIAGGANGVVAQTGKVGKADLAPLAVEAAALAEGAVDLSSGKVKNAEKFGALAVGYTVTQYLLAMNGVMGNLTVDNAQIANISADKLSVGSGVIGGTLKSNNYVYGLSGWRIQPDGQAWFNGINISGNSYFDGQVTIRAPGGRVILQSGGKMAAGDITPDSGWLNSNQQWGEVQGRPPEDAIRNNLIDLGWWKAGATIPWAQNREVNTLYSTAEISNNIGGPKGSHDVVWYCREAAGDGLEGGGWDAPNALLLDPSKTYRFALPIYKRDGVGGSAYWGPQPYTVCHNNTTNLHDNPYFGWTGRDGMLTDRWYLFVGYVYPQGSTGNSNDGAGIWDCKTGAKVVDGYSFCHAAGGAKGHRAYQYYAGIGSTQLFGRPMVNVVDGTEPSLREYFAPGAVLNSALEPSITAAAQAAAAAQQSAAAAQSVLATMRSNGYLDASEKPEVIRRWLATVDERAGIVAQANAYGIVAARNSYTDAHDALNAYLSSLSPAYNNTTTDTPITPATDQATWNAYYSARQSLLNSIADEAGKRAAWSGVSGPGKPQDNATVGATLGVNVSGKITQLNASTLIDTAAINGAMIGELIAENIVLTQLSRAQNGLPSGAALSGRRVQSVPGGLEFYRDNGTRSVVIVA